MTVPDPVTFSSTADFGPFLRKARRRRGWSAKYLADQVGVCGPTVTQCEIGKRTPSAANLIQLLDALGYDLQAVRR
jgi:transcriptional regulator with XRE-family HTH domain